MKRLAEGRAGARAGVQQNDSTTASGCASPIGMLSSSRAPALLTTCRDDTKEMACRVDQAGWHH